MILIIQKKIFNRFFKTMDVNFIFSKFDNLSCQYLAFVILFMY